MMLVVQWVPLRVGGHPMDALLCLRDAPAALQLGWTAAPHRRLQAHPAPLAQFHLLSAQSIHCHPCSESYSHLGAQHAGADFDLQALSQEGFR